MEIVATTREAKMRGVKLGRLSASISSWAALTLIVRSSCPARYVTYVTDVPSEFCKG